MTPRLSHRISEQSVKVCQQLGITGRVFANDVQAIAITEGETKIVRQYYAAVQADPLVETIIIHSRQPIREREFSDYSVWLNSREVHECGPQVMRLTPENLREALPAAPSANIRTMVKAFLRPKPFAA